MLPPLTPERVGEWLNVSRETLARLEAYVQLLTAWNRRINLVGPRTLRDVWRRHILDSGQLLAQIPPKARILVDLGSGAGLPGLILAILGVPEVHLIESDGRKCAFLREAARITETPVTLHQKRIADVPGFAADVITARALAPLSDLLDHGARFCVPHSILLFLKGETLSEELTQAAKVWNMSHRLVPSISDPSGTILRLEKVTRAGDSGKH
jgi:16S rRNA (guanine527-N7)-methyltransferase